MHEDMMPLMHCTTHHNHERLPPYTPDNTGVRARVGLSSLSILPPREWDVGHLLLQRGVEFEKEDVVDDERGHDDFGYFPAFSVALDVINIFINWLML